MRFVTNKSPAGQNFSCHLRSAQRFTVKWAEMFTDRGKMVEHLTDN